MTNRKMLVVYNTCGIKRDNTAWYIKCLTSIINQDLEGYRVVLSSCLNSSQCIRKINATFGNQISYSLHSEPHTVNVTFNKAVQDAVRRFGEYESYLYIDSGCILGEFDGDNYFLDRSSLSRIYNTFKEGQYGMLTTQSDSDEGFHILDKKFKHSTKQIQITGEDYVIPMGKAVNVHVHLYSNEIFKKFNGKLLPDVFAAFCTESVFNFVCASVKKRWAIMKDWQCHHKWSLDGASSSRNHHSLVHKNPWNNLLYGRNALDFINDKEAYRVGLGYEECNDIMNHNPSAYDTNGTALYPEELSQMINKYFYLSNDELDYDKIKSLFVS